MEQAVPLERGVPRQPVRGWDPVQLLVQLGEQGTVTSKSQGNRVVEHRRTGDPVHDEVAGTCVVDAGHGEAPGAGIGHDLGLRHQ